MRQRCKDQGIGSRPKRDQIDCGLWGFEYIPDILHSLCGGIISAIGQGITHICCIERCHHIGVHGAGISVQGWTIPEFEVPEEEWEDHIIED